MLRLLYVSSAATLFSKSELTDLLQRSRHNNDQAGITGILLYKDGNFMQVLEGEETTVKGLFERIGRDPRHSGVIVMLKENVEDRSFPDWSMGFRDLNDPAVHAIEGYNEFLNTPLNPALSPQRCFKLLEIFRKRM